MAIPFGYATLLALSQTGIQSAESAYLEGSACQLQASWFDNDGNAYLPSLVNYRLDDVLSMEQILPWTSIIPAEVNTVAVTTAQNLMINATREHETHQALFQVTGQDNNVSFVRVTFKVMRAAGAP